MFADEQAQSQTVDTNSTNEPNQQQWPATEVCFHSFLKLIYLLNRSSKNRKSQFLN